MSTIHSEDGLFLFIDNDDNVQHLMNAVNFSINHSKVNFHAFDEDGQAIFTFFEEISSWLKAIHDGSFVSIARNIILLSTLNELIQKPRCYNFLQIGNYSLFSKCLAEALQKFNEQNHMYCLTDKKSSKEVPNVSFISLNLGEDLLPRSKFSAVFIESRRFKALSDIPAEVVLSLCNGGKLFFLTSPNSVEPSREIEEFKLNEKLSLISFCVSSKTKMELYEQTFEAKLFHQKRQVLSSVNRLSRTIHRLSFLPDDERIALLDSTIKLIAQSERIINEIYLELNSMYIKSYLNELKEAMIEYRLHGNSASKKLHISKIEERYGVLLNEMISCDDFDVAEEVV